MGSFVPAEAGVKQVGRLRRCLARLPVRNPCGWDTDDSSNDPKGHNPKKQLKLDIIHNLLIIKALEDCSVHHVMKCIEKGFHTIFPEILPTKVKDKETA